MIIGIDKKELQKQREQKYNEYAVLLNSSNPSSEELNALKSELKYLDDLTIYKDNKVEFYSCTHESFNSIKLDYKSMSDVEILEFINDEYCEENIIDVDMIKELNSDDESLFIECFGVSSKEEMLDFANDERSGKNKENTIEIINKLISMEEGTKFSFKELGISSKMLMNKI